MQGGEACARFDTGTVICDGLEVPTDLGVVTAISAGATHACALELGGKVRCWGNDTAGETVVPADLGEVTELRTGLLTTCALETTGRTRCWGSLEVPRYVMQ